MSSSYSLLLLEEFDTSSYRKRRFLLASFSSDLSQRSLQVVWYISCPFLLASDISYYLVLSLILIVISPCSLLFDLVPVFCRFPIERRWISFLFYRFPIEDVRMVYHSNWVKKKLSFFRSKPQSLFFAGQLHSFIPTSNLVLLSVCHSNPSRMSEGSPKLMCVCFVSLS